MTITYWLKGYETQNFGDFLSEYIFGSLAVGFRVTAHAYHLIGSVISEDFIERSLKDVPDDENGRIVFWCCGARHEKAITKDAARRAVICGVRGPLTRDALGLSSATVMGDPAFLLPLFHRRATDAETGGKAICVPHYLDGKQDVELRQLTGADFVLRPNIPNDIAAVGRFVDQIASAGFVLTGSLHAAAVACVYDVPFCYLDDGFVDVPFKWRDLSASIGIGTYFTSSVEEGRAIYEGVIRKQVRKPMLLPLLAVAPFSTKREYLYAAALTDMQRLKPDGSLDRDMFNAVVEAIDNNTSATVHSLAMQIRDAEQKVSRQASDLSAQQLEIDDLIRQLQKKENEIILRDSQIEELKTRLNAHNRWQFWFDRGRDAS